MKTYIYVLEDELATQQSAEVHQQSLTADGELAYAHIVKNPRPYTIHSTYWQDSERIEDALIRLIQTINKRCGNRFAHIYGLKPLTISRLKKHLSNNHRNYILDEDHNLVPCDDARKWGKWFEKTNRRVDSTEIIVKLSKKVVGYRCRVSTVFLGLDHSFSQESPPLLFESMTFCSLEEMDGWTERCTTWDEAVEMHKKMVEKVKSYKREPKDGRKTATT